MHLYDTYYTFSLSYLINYRPTLPMWFWPVCGLWELASLGLLLNGKEKVVFYYYYSLSLPSSSSSSSSSSNVDCSSFIICFFGRSLLLCNSIRPEEDTNGNRSYIYNSCCSNHWISPRPF